MSGVVGLYRVLKKTGKYNQFHKVEYTLKPMGGKVETGWRVLKLNLPKEIRDNLWRELSRLGALHGCPIAAEPTNDATGVTQPNLISILERVTEILRESPDELLKQLK